MAEIKPVTPPTIEEKISLLHEKMDKNIVYEQISSLLFTDVVPTTTDVIVSDHVFSDLEMFSDYGGVGHTPGGPGTPGGAAVIDKIDMTATIFGRVCLENLIRKPISNIHILSERQNLVKKFIKSGTDTDNIANLMGSLSNCEDGLLWFWKETTEDVQSLYDMVYFNMEAIKPLAEKLNDNEEVLMCSSYYTIMVSPLMTAVGPILTVVIPMVLLKLTNSSIPVWELMKLMVRSMLKIDVLAALPWKAKLVTLAGMTAWFLFYLYSVYNSYCSARHTHTIINILHQKLRKIVEFTDKTRQIYKICNKLDIPLGDFALDESLDWYSKLFRNDVLKEDPSLINNKGCILRIYRKFMETKGMLLPLMNFVAHVDAYMSISKLFSKYSDGSSRGNKYCFPKYEVNQDKTELVIKKMWHPYLEEGVITNNLTMKGDKINILITGPNAAGKSTYIKAAALGVLMAQTIGIVPGDKMVITPFEVINSYLHIPDCKGRDSLFQAEMHRCKEHLDLLENNKNTRSFVVIDEIFSSTNYKEGLSAAYAVCKKLIKYPKSVSIITTHFTDLSEISKEADGGRLSNYRFNAVVNPEGISFNYKIEEGVSQQYIALNLLKNDGFDEDIIKDATEMCDRVSLDVKKKIESDK